MCDNERAEEHLHFAEDADVELSFALDMASSMTLAG